VSDVSIALAVTGERLLRPPRAELHFTAQFRNEGATPVWVVIPDDLTDSAALGAGLSALDRYELGDGALQVAHGLGSGGCFALCIAAASTLELEALPLAYWGAIPEELVVRLIVASAVLVDGRPLEEHLALSGACTGVDRPVDASPLADQYAVVEAAHPAEGEHFVATFPDAEQHELRVRVP
jgi:hypothetical protein